MLRALFLNFVAWVAFITRFNPCGLYLATYRYLIRSFCMKFTTKKVLLAPFDVHPESWSVANDGSDFPRLSVPGIGVRIYAEGEGEYLPQLLICRANGLDTVPGLFNEIYEQVSFLGLHGLPPLLPPPPVPPSPPSSPLPEQPFAAISSTVVLAWTRP